MKSIRIAGALLLLVAISRFASFAGFDPAHYVDVLKFYSTSTIRMGFFCLHFVGLLVLGNTYLLQVKPDIGAFAVAVGGLFIVSGLRYFVPFFLVAVVGDFLVVSWYRSEVGTKSPNDP